MNCNLLSVVSTPIGKFGKFEKFNVLLEYEL